MCQWNQAFASAYEKSHLSSGQIGLLKFIKSHLAIVSSLSSFTFEHSLVVYSKVY